MVDILLSMFMNVSTSFCTHGQMHGCKTDPVRSIQLKYVYILSYAVVEQLINRKSLSVVVLINR